MRALLRTPNNPRRHRSSVWRRCKGRPAIFSMLTRFAGAVSSGSDSCPVVRIRQGPVTRKGRVDRKQGAVLGRKSHCPQRGPCDGAAVRERDRPFGTAARERDRPFGTAARERDRRSGQRSGEGTGRSGQRPGKGTGRSGQRSGKGTGRSGQLPGKGQAVRDAANQLGLRTAGRFRACPNSCLIRVDGTLWKDSRLSWGTCGNREPERGSRARVVLSRPMSHRMAGWTARSDTSAGESECRWAMRGCPSGVSSHHRPGRTVGHTCVGSECRWAMRGCSGVRVGSGHGHGTSERKRGRSWARAVSPVDGMARGF